MIIAVDAGMLGMGDERLKVGVWRVAVNLLIQLGKIDKKNTYRLYSFTPVPQDLMAQFGPRMENHVLTPGTGWMSVRLPLEFILRTPDLFLGLAQALPRWTGKKIGFIYDLGFLKHPEAYPDSHEKLTRQTQQVASRAHHIITISQATKEEIHRYYQVSQEKITVAYPGVGLPFTKETKAHAASHPYFLFVGALKRGKNVSTILRAFAVFRKKTQLPHELILIGSDYWMDPAIDATMQELNISHAVKLCGFVTDSVLASYYRGATALVVPSLVEGFCLPAVEAMASGTPVLASPAGSLPEVVGAGGVIVELNDINGFAGAMKKLAGDSEYRTKIAKAARVRSRTFNWNHFARIVFDSFDL